MPEIIDSFRGEYSFLSNYEFAPIHFEGKWFPTNEHAFVYCKNPDQWDDLWLEYKPGEVKKLGHKVELIPNWDNGIKFEKMKAINVEKYTQQSDLGKKLIATGDARLIEGNWWHDNYWGACTCRKCTNWHSVMRMLPGNALGVILMQIRDELRNGG